MIAQTSRPAQAVRVGILYAAAASLLWAAIESIGPLLGTPHHPLQVVWTRYATHLALLIVVFAPLRGAALVHTSRLRLQVARGLLMLLMPLCFLAAISVGRPADVLGVFWIMPLLAVAFAVWLLRERVERLRWLATLGGLAGVLLVVRPGTGVIGLATLPALGMAASMSLYLVLTRLLRNESTLTNLVFTAAVVLAPLSLVLPDFWRAPSARSLALMVTIGLLGLGSLYAFDRALELAPTSVVAPALYAQPVFAVVLATAAGDLHLSRAAVLGSVLVVAVYAVLFIGIGWHRTESALSGARQLRARS